MVSGVSRRIALGTAAAAVLSVFGAGTVPAQTWPARPVKLIVTFPPGGAFAVDSTLATVPGKPARLAFRFTAARLITPTRSLTLPPVGQGWFDTVYLDGTYRVARDVRGDPLVVRRAAAPFVA